MHNKQRGFTLIELMVVLALIALLASVILASVRTAGAKGRDAARRENLSAVKLALELRFNELNNYPTVAGETTPWTDASISSALTAYLPGGAPKDPLDPVWHAPYYTSNGSVYSIKMEFENGDICKTGGSGVDPAWFGGAELCEK
jgi:prepilin-type N-terminal cleavage/methylation domain-containing protein